MFITCLQGKASQHFDASSTNLNFPNKRHTLSFLAREEPHMQVGVADRMHPGGNPQGQMRLCLHPRHGSTTHEQEAATKMVRPACMRAHLNSALGARACQACSGSVAAATARQPATNLPDVALEHHADAVTLQQRKACENLQHDVLLHHVILFGASRHWLGRRLRRGGRAAAKLPGWWAGGALLLVAAVLGVSIQRRRQKQQRRTRMLRLHRQSMTSTELAGTFNVSPPWAARPCPLCP